MRFLVASLVVAMWTGCGSPDRRGGDDQEPDACSGLDCRIVNCAQRNMPETSVSGTVFAPNGTLALYGVNVYVPASPPPLLTDGVQCSQCQKELPGGAVVSALSGADGKFTLTKVPSGINIPLVIQVGKWRRIVDIPEILPCQDNVLPANITALPRNKTEGDLPKIAIATGSNDALECLVRKLGVDPREFTTEGGTGRVHLYRGNGHSALSDGTPLPMAETLWNSLDKMKLYDIAVFGCEGSEHAGLTTQMMANVKSFADVGGRLFMSHYHRQWISGHHTSVSSGVVDVPQQVWPSVATCALSNFPPDPSVGVIDQVENPKGAAFATWMQNVMGTAGGGTFSIEAPRQSCSTVDMNKVERWVYLQSGNIPQNFQFTTPQESPEDNRCGKVVFSDMHVGGENLSSGNFPTSCSSTPLTPQEKALSFMFFDIASCVGPIL